MNQTFVSLDPSADYTPQLAQLASANPDGVALIGSTDINARVIQGLRGAGYTGLIGVPGSAVSAQSLEDLGDFGEGLVIASSYLAATDTGEAMTRFNADMEEFAPDAARSEFAVNAWASVHVLAEVLGELDSIDAAALIGALDGREVDLGVAPPFTLGVADNPYGLPRVFRATVQVQLVEDGEIVPAGDGAFLDLNDLAGG